MTVALVIHRKVSIVRGVAPDTTLVDAVSF
jgi:hypothetical protein